MDRFTEEQYGTRSNRLMAIADAQRCDACGEVESDLNRVQEYAVPFLACDECYARIQAELEECTCEQTDVDLFDARGCAAHNGARRVA